MQLDQGQITAWLRREARFTDAGGGGWLVQDNVRVHVLPEPGHVHVFVVDGTDAWSAKLDGAPLRTVAAVLRSAGITAPSPEGVR